MADHSKIEWTDATWNPITGCSVISPGCTNCYAMRLAGKRLAHLPSRAGLTQESKAGPVWTGEVRLNEQWLTQPLRWKRPRRIFVCAHGDLFHEAVPDEWIDRVFAVMALAPQHTFQVLTKRAARMRAYVSGHDSAVPYLGRMPLERVHMEAAGHIEGDGGYMDALKKAGNVYSLYLDAPWPLPNVWLGVSCEDQARADERIHELLHTRAAVRWISAEPLLGDIDWRRWLPTKSKARRTSGETFLAPCFFLTRCELCGWTGSSELCHVSHNIDDADVVCPSCERIFLCDEIAGEIGWVVAGGESGPGARPMHPDWARSLRDQCAAAGVPFFFKQHGEWLPTCDDNGEISYGRHERRGWDIDGHEEAWAYRVGKARAGRLLDGREHDDFPAPLSGRA